MPSKNGVLMYFHQKYGRGATPANPPLPFGFTDITDHLRVEEVRLDCSLQAGMAPVRILIGFPFRAVESAGVADS
jgi:hypothetical protein